MHPPVTENASEKTLCVVFAAGGTGGHIMPALAVAEAIKRQAPQCQILFLGVGREVERSLVPLAGFELKVIPSVPLVGVGILGYLRFLLRLPGLLFRFIQVYRLYHPQVVVGFGGYPSFLPVVTAWLRRVPCVIHEQNVQVGWANKVLSLVAAKIFAVQGADDFWRKAKVCSLPNPVRAVFREVPAWRFPERGEPLCIVVFGGSQGAVSLNSAIVDLVQFFKEHGISLIHQTGASDFLRLEKYYREEVFLPLRLAPFIDDVANVLAQAHLVVSRAGAMAVAEITASGRPAIYVPLPIAGGHQAQNIKYLVQQKAALIVEQNSELVRNLERLLRYLVVNPRELAQMAQRAKESSSAKGISTAEVMAREIFSLASR